VNDVLEAYDITEQDFATRVLEASRKMPVLVDFWAPWCGPCRALSPILDKLAEAYRGSLWLAKVNTDDERMLARDYGIRALPTVKMFKDASAVDEFTGVLPESAIRAFIERHIVRESEKTLREALAAFDAGNAQTALDSLLKLRETHPEDNVIKIAVAKVLMRTGAFDEAQSLLDTLPVDLAVTAEIKQLQAQLAFARAAANGDASETELEQTVDRSPHDLPARYRLAARKVMHDDYEGALEQLLEIMRQDRRFGEDAGRKGMLSVFEILGGKGELVNRYRSRMVNLLH
jgi:putative thioredoxin